MNGISALQVAVYVLDVSVCVCVCQMTEQRKHKQRMGFLHSRSLCMCWTCPSVCVSDDRAEETETANGISALQVTARPTILT